MQYYTLYHSVKAFIPKMIIKKKKKKKIIIIIIIIILYNNGIPHYDASKKSDTEQTLQWPYRKI